MIDGDLIPALDHVGQGFEKKTMFLPQLLMSADAAKAGFDAIKEHLKAKGDDSASKGTIVIATVKGDIHDIGKNIVKVLLENYGFEVIEYADMIGADFYSKDAMGSVRYANELFGA